MNIQINTKESNRTDLTPLCFKNRRIDSSTLSQNHIIARKLPQIVQQELVNFLIGCNPKVMIGFICILYLEDIK